jgi:hypothetical protein
MLEGLGMTAGRSRELVERQGRLARRLAAARVWYKSIRGYRGEARDATAME